jgi:putative ABC transport system substrate-binding protein
LSILERGTTQKRLELLKEAVPGASRVAVLWNPANPTHVVAWREAQDGAAALGVDLLSLEMRSPSELESAFEVASRGGVDALIVMADPLFSNPVVAPQVFDFASKNRLPSISMARSDAEAGGLMSYGPSFPALFRRSAYYVDRILKGTKPADLPIEQPMTFDFVVNMKTARELGITFPNEIMLQVTEVIDQ